ncbi:hypothetical protein Cgig2_029149 [Carnegiea gigantea]|uniref:HMA domain-containing protein n=1 Tax=Carnegiea gigantea TaxID=171969 RepID=A0A9Q1KL60_9CARY|nr:hypothetical protein Cgig2_029149 [Carnegiea gigantea]
MVPELEFQKHLGNHSNLLSIFALNKMQRPRITEIHVRMDCNGCVQKVRKAVNSIDGVYDLYIDLPQQKLTVIGRADPERIIKAIKKVRKVATICSHTDVRDENSQPQEPPADGGAPPPQGEATRPEGGEPSSTEPPKSEVPPPPPEEPPKDQRPPPTPPPENLSAQNPPPETNPSPPVIDNPPCQPENLSKPNDQEEVHVIYHHPPDYGYRYGYGSGYATGYSHGDYGNWNSRPGSSFRHETPAQPIYHDPPHRVYHEVPHHPLYQEHPQPVYYERPPPRTVYHESPGHVYHEPSARPVYHEPPPRPSYHEPPPRPSYYEPPPRPSYYEPPPRPSYQEPPPQSQPVYVTHSYNTSRPSPYITAYQYAQSPPQYTTYSRMDHYTTDPYWDTEASSGNAGSMFSDENPNACTIV